jgi:hypothetical protein
MDKNINKFKPIFDSSSSEIILSKIQKKEWNVIFEGLCNIQNNSVIIDYVYFKICATKDTYDLILNYLILKIDSILNNKSSFSTYINLKNLTVLEIDKHGQFIQHLSGILKDRYPNKLEKCYIYNAPFVFAKIYNIVSRFIDKDTQTKIELIDSR